MNEIVGTKERRKEVCYNSVEISKYTLIEIHEMICANLTSRYGRDLKQASKQKFISPSKYRVVQLALDISCSFKYIYNFLQSIATNSNYNPFDVDFCIVFSVFFSKNFSKRFERIAHFF